jgi:hypothetical protein
MKVYNLKIIPGFFCILAVLAAAVFAACENPWMKDAVGPLYKNKDGGDNNDGGGGWGPAPGVALTAAGPTEWATALTAVQGSSETLFTITVTTDMTLSPQLLTDPDYAGKTIILKGDTPSRTVGLASVGSLFTVGAAGTDLTLELENIVLQGRTDNNVPLISVNTGGKLTVKTGGTVTGNTAAVYSGFGGGVFVNSGATFVLDGGIVSNNTISGSSDARGGGVFVWGTFTMNSGTITGNNATNTGTLGARGAGVYVEISGIFTMMGGTISWNTVHSNGHASGGGVSVFAASSFIMGNGTITNNTVSTTSAVLQNGGGLNCYNSSGFTGNLANISGNWSVKGADPPVSSEWHFDT